MEKTMNRRYHFNKRKFGVSVLRWSLTVLICFVVLLPIWWIFISSISTRAELYRTPIHYFPEHPTLANYQQVFANMQMGKKILNTGIITGFALIASILVGTMASYAFARFHGKSLKVANMMLLFSSMIPGIVTARTSYDFMNSMKLIDTYPGLIILYTSSLLPFTVMVLQSFIQQIPYSIEEAAEVDGANFIVKVFTIIFPLMGPAISTIAIINFINCLNNLFTPLFFSNRIEVLSVAITTVPRENVFSEPWDLIATIGCIIIIPIIIFVLLFEKKIMEGIMAGGVKQ